MFVQILTTNFKIIICAIDGEIGNYQNKGNSIVQCKCCFGWELILVVDLML